MKNEWEIKYKTERGWKNLVWLSSNHEDNIEKTEETQMELIAKAVEGNTLLKYQEINRLLKKTQKPKRRNKHNW
jgi:hypothetical protein